jgi:hypothetical protein
MASFSPAVFCRAISSSVIASTWWCEYDHKHTFLDFAFHLVAGLSIIVSVVFYHNTVRIEKTLCCLGEIKSAFYITSVTFIRAPFKFHIPNIVHRTTYGKTIFIFLIEADKGTPTL